MSHDKYVVPYYVFGLLLVRLLAISAFTQHAHLLVVVLFTCMLFDTIALLLRDRRWHVEMMCWDLFLMVTVVTLKGLVRR